MKVAVVGATGLVGGVMLKVLEERNFPVDELLAVASERSAGKCVRFRERMFGHRHGRSRCREAGYRLFRRVGALRWNGPPLRRGRLHGGRQQ